MRDPNRSILAALVALLVTVPDTSWAQGDADATGTAGSTPLVVLLVANSTADAQREQRFVTELKLVLDGLPVVTTRRLGRGFVDFSLAKQIALVRPLLRSTNAVAAVWISAPTPDQIILQLVAVSAGRAMVRLIETKAASGSAASLALASRELLGTVYMFEPRSQDASSPVARVVEAVREQVAPTPKADPPAKWRFVARTATRGGLYGGSGPSLWVGGSAGMERLFESRLFGRVVLDAAFGPLGRLAGATLHGVALCPMLEGAYLWDGGPFSLGPALGLGAEWMQLRVQAGTGGETEHSAWHLRAAAALDARLRVAESFSLTAQAGISLFAPRERYTKRSEGSVIATQPHLLMWTASLGAAF